MKPIIDDGGDTLTSFFWKGTTVKGEYIPKTGYKIYEIKDHRQGNKFILINLTFKLKLLMSL